MNAQEGDKGMVSKQRLGIFGSGLAINVTGGRRKDRKSY